MDGTLDYQVTLKKEVLREIAAGVVADYSKYMLNHKISPTDSNNPVTVLVNEVYNLQEDIIEFRSPELLFAAEQTLQAFKRVLERLSVNG